MTRNNSEIAPMEDPLAQLERELINAYIRGAGQDVEALRARG